MTQQDWNIVCYHICSIALRISKQYSPNLVEFQERCQNLKMGLLPGAFLLLWGSAFGAMAQDAVHGAAHDAFMTLPAYTRTREGHVHPLGSGPKPCRLGLGVRKASPPFDS